MGRASHGGMCPLCGKYASRRLDGRLYVHRGAVRHLIGAGFRECRASTQTLETAYAMRTNQDAGRNPCRNEDGSWIKLR